MKPALHTVSATTFLVSHHAVSLADLQEIRKTAVPQLRSLIEELNLKVTGPLVFFYFDFNPEATNNRLEIGFPVSYSATEVGQFPEPFQLRQTDPFFCLTTDYTGNTAGIQEAWRQLLAAAADSGYAVGVEQREIYQDWAGPDSTTNAVELQLQILKPPFTE